MRNEIKLSRRELKTLFYPGRKLELVESLMGIGPTQPRTVKEQKSYGYVMQRNDGRLSYLRFSAGDTIHGVDGGNGFTEVVVRTAEGSIAARYELK